MKKRLLSLVSLLLVVLLIAAATVCFSSCAPKTTETGATITETHTVGEGATTITVSVVNDKKEAAVFTIHTNATTLRGALEENNLVEGSDSQYGLFIESVNGLRADYSANGAWWAIYIGSEMASTGVDGITLTDGGSYSLVYTVG